MASTHQQWIDDNLPGALPEAHFIARTAELLGALGFTPDNTIACVGVCRDELTRSFVSAVDRTWGEAFNFSSLAGLLFLGRTGFNAAHHHAPLDGGRERYVYYAMAHIGVGPGGEVGACERLGRPGRSTACGSLHALLADLGAGQVKTKLDPDDVEQSLVRQRLLGELAWGEVPDLMQLTRIAHRAIRGDLERSIALTVDPAKADYALFTGIQVHAPERAQYVWPGHSKAVVAGQEAPLAPGGVLS